MDSQAANSNLSFYNSCRNHSLVLINERTVVFNDNAACLKLAEMLKCWNDLLIPKIQVTFTQLHPLITCTSVYTTVLPTARRTIECYYGMVEFYFSEVKRESCRWEETINNFMSQDILAHDQHVFLISKSISMKMCEERTLVFDKDNHGFHVIFWTTMKLNGLFSGFSRNC